MMQVENERREETMKKLRSIMMACLVPVLVLACVLAFNVTSEASESAEGYDKIVCITTSNSDGTKDVIYKDMPDDKDHITVYEAKKMAGAASGKTVTEIRYGIDVSHHQKIIDWDAVKAEGMQFAFVRVGYRSEAAEGKLGEDKYYRRNLSEANRVGIPVGAYIYSQAINQQEAREEAQFLMQRVRDYKISLPLVIDYESTNGDEVKGRLQVYYNMGLVTKEIGTGNCWAFCDEIQKSGMYTPMVYANKYWLNNYIDGKALGEQFRIWVAQYNSENTYKEPWDFWQYSSKGQIAGIEGNVDCNAWYIKDGIVDFSYSGVAEVDTDGDGVKELRYINGGGVDKEYTGAAYNGNTLVYFDNGVVDTKYTGMACTPDGAWWYFNNGSRDPYYTGMASNAYGWWYFNNGSVDFNYTGMAQNDYGWWYYKNGTIDFKYNGLGHNSLGLWVYRNGNIDFNLNGMVEVGGTWYYADGGKLTDYTGMAQNDYGWWYYNNGILDFNYKGIGTNEYGSWVMKNGTVDYSCNGMVEVGGSWRYASEGKLVKYTGMANNRFGWWYYRDGYLDFGYTGMASNEYGWWYYRNGNIDFGYNGVGHNEYGDWLYQNGTIAWNQSGMVFVSGDWKFAQNGQLIKYTGMACNEYGWWYYRNGNIDFGYNGVGHNEYGDWLYQNGTIAWAYTGMAYTNDGWKYAQNGQLISYTGMASNEVGWWYYIDGEIDWIHTGIETNEFGTWYYQNGNIDFNFNGTVDIDGKTYNVAGGRVL